MMTHPKDSREEANSRLVKNGWFIGLGMIIPICLGFVLATFLNSKYYAWMDKESDASFTNPLNETDIKDIIIDSYKDTRLGNTVLVLGKLTNKGKSRVNTINLEAEFFNEKGEFVYEETAYINRKIEPGMSENFQISCGCDKTAFPQYTKVIVTVSSVSKF